MNARAPRWRRAALRVQFSFLIFAYLCRKAGFNPDQPRDEQGRWTDTGGSTPPALSDATPDNGWQPGAQYAQNDRQTGYPVDLMEERQLGGHAIERHVGKSEEFLLADVRQRILIAAENGDLADGLRTGSFSSLEAANKLVNATIARNQSQVDLVASGVSPREELDAEFNSITGYEAYARTERSRAYIRDTYGVRVVVVRDFRMEKGYRVDTAFPRNFDR